MTFYCLTLNCFYMQYLSKTWRPKKIQKFPNTSFDVVLTQLVQLVNIIATFGEGTTSEHTVRFLPAVSLNYIVSIQAPVEANIDQVDQVLRAPNAPHTNHEAARCQPNSARVCLTINNKGFARQSIISQQTLSLICILLILCFYCLCCLV